MKKKKGQSYKFFFPSKDSNLHYEAFYYGENLIIEQSDLGFLDELLKNPQGGTLDSRFSNKLLPLRGKEAWDIFYKHCRIIVPAVHICVQISKSEATQTEIEEAIGSEYPKFIARSNGLTLPNYGKILNLIREKPHVLHNKKVRDIFIDIIEEAGEDFVDKKNAKKCRFLLKENLIPKNPHNKKNIPSQAITNTGIKLSKRLAKHLSDKCKTILEMEGIEAGRNLEYDNDIYKTLIEWATKNHEPRIYELSEDSLKDLILSPSKFVENLVSKELQISIKTLTGKHF